MNEQEIQKFADELLSICQTRIGRGVLKIKEINISEDLHGEATVKLVMQGEPTPVFSWKKPGEFL